MGCNRKTLIKSKEITYKLRRRKGNKNIRLSIYPDGMISVSAPKWYPLYLIEKFIQEKSSWVLKNIAGMDFGLREKEEKLCYIKNKEKARKLIEEKVRFLNQFYQFSFERISIRNQRTCWGSCSKKRNLNFNYKIIQLPEDLQDYVIVHELCHLRELNHGQRFWDLVSITIPNYKEKIKMLRNIRL